MMKPSVTVVDVGIGNIASVCNMIRHVGGEAKVTSDNGEVCDSECILLPGVGSFDAGMRALEDKGMVKSLLSAAEQGARLMGICLGFQLLLEGSDEGQRPGLGLIAGRSIRFSFSDRSLPIPHMGWAEVRPTQGAKLFRGALNPRFYFVHSYFASLEDESDVAAWATYGHPFPCAVQRGSVFGVQFHPEKSHRFGMAFFNRVLEL